MTPNPCTADPGPLQTVLDHVAERGGVVLGGRLLGPRASVTVRYPGVPGRCIVSTAPAVEGSPC